MWSPNELLKTEKQRDILSYITLQFFPFKKVPLEHYPFRGAFLFEDFGNFLLLCCTRRDKRGILRRITTNEAMRRYDAY